MRWAITFLALFSFPFGTSYASGGAFHLLHAHADVSDKASLQRGAKLFMNYCSGCHSLKYLRYSQMAQGLGLMTFDGNLDKPLLVNNLVFTQAKTEAPIENAMPPTDSREWFGKVPPDLSLVARVRGADWLYTYLLNFYQDDSKPFKANNWLFPDVAMPNVLEPLQGRQIAVYKTREFNFGGKVKKEKVISHLLVTDEGTMSEHQFQSAVKDIVTFLSFAGEPVQLERQRLGVWVIVFLFVLLAFSYALKKFYWKQLK